MKHYHRPIIIVVWWSVACAVTLGSGFAGYLLGFGVYAGLFSGMIIAALSATVVTECLRLLVKEDISMFNRFRIPLFLACFVAMLGVVIWFNITDVVLAPSIHTKPPPPFSSPSPGMCGDSTNHIVFIRPTTPGTRDLFNREIKQEAASVAAAQANLKDMEASGNALQIAQAEQNYQYVKDHYNALRNCL